MADGLYETFPLNTGSLPACSLWRPTTVQESKVFAPIIGGIVNPDQVNLLSLRRLPARLTVEETAYFLGFKPGDISILMVSKLLKPLGHPPANGQKFFAACELERLRNDGDWLAKASDALVRHWRQRNREQALQSTT